MQFTRKEFLDLSARGTLALAAASAFDFLAGGAAEARDAVGSAAAS